MTAFILILRDQVIAVINETIFINIVDLAEEINADKSHGLY
jgi:hypothetical protein